jgi:hypothetical protein
VNIVNTNNGTRQWTNYLNMSIYHGR